MENFTKIFSKYFWKAKWNEQLFLHLVKWKPLLNFIKNNINHTEIYNTIKNSNFLNENNFWI